MLVAMPCGIVQADDGIVAEQQSAKTWGMHRIAVIQAADGDVLGAKRTLSQIDDNGPKGPSQVTVVSFCNGLPVYKTFDDVEQTMEKSPGWGGYDVLGTQFFLAADRPIDQIPAELPAGLPKGYLDADPNHGPLVDFTDECDSHGTRVTSRTYADGYTMIETPRPGGM
jgi:hypothetical protein